MFLQYLKNAFDYMFHIRFKFIVYLMIATVGFINIRVLTSTSYFVFQLKIHLKCLLSTLKIRVFSAENHNNSKV